MQKSSAMKSGLSEKTSVGRAGQYRQGVSTDTLLLGTCIARGTEFFTHGSPMTPLMALELPLTHTRAHLGSGWTGRSFRFAWGADATATGAPKGGLDLHLGWTLPGPLFTNFGRTLHLRFAFANAPAVVNDLEKGVRCLTFNHSHLGRILSLEGSRRPALIVASAPIAKIHVISHEHMALTFTQPANVMWVPLLDAADLPQTKAARAPWIELVQAPPLHCAETYALHGTRLETCQTFSSPTGKPPTLAPLPPLSVLLGSSGNLQKIPAHRVLCKTLLGPYAYVRGAQTKTTIDVSWARAGIANAKPVTGKLEPIPSELAYAGDVSWVPGTPMDQLISLRVWAPLAGIMPKATWAKLRKMLMPPTAKALSKSLAYFTEPGCGKPWAKEALLFAEHGDVSYDSDWYNGFTLSGMQRAVVCADAEIAAKAKALMRGSRRERGLLQDYMKVFHDWSLGCSWTDPRGETWNLDCSHNGMEGLLAESRMRRMEGNLAGEAESLYLAGKMAVAFMAAYPLTDWCRMVNFIHGDGCAPQAGSHGSTAKPGAAPLKFGEVPKGYLAPHLGISDFREYRGAAISGPSGKGPYAFAGNFPEWNYLLREHGPMERFRQVARIWENKYPERYRDWSFYYIGKHVGRGVKSWNQEERIQAAVMYHIAPDIGLRLWTLRQSGARVEKLFKTPLNLAEQLWCRSGATVEKLPLH